MEAEKKESVGYLQLSERTVKLHRNLLVFSMFAIVYKAYNLKFTKFAAAGIEIEGFANGVMSTVLFMTLAYHAFAYATYFIEEWRHWLLAFADYERLLFGNGAVKIPIIDKLSSELESLESMTGPEGEQILEKIGNVLVIYKRHFLSYKHIAMVRIFVFEVAIPIAALAVAVGALTGLLSLIWVRDLFATLPQGVRPSWSAAGV